MCVMSILHILITLKFYIQLIYVHITDSHNI